MGFLKLDCEILNSSVWIDRDVRDVFLTALLMALPRDVEEPLPQLEVDSLEPTGFVVPPGYYGFVPAAGPGIVARAGVEYARGVVALRVLGSPEATSRSPEFEGRRLVRVSGGYVALNYSTYRERDYGGAERARRYRQRHAPTVTSRRDGVTGGEDRHASRRDITQAEAEDIERKEDKKSSAAADRHASRRDGEGKLRGAEAKWRELFLEPFSSSEEFADAFTAFLLERRKKARGGYTEQGLRAVAKRLRSWGLLVATAQVARSVGYQGILDPPPLWRGAATPARTEGDLDSGNLRVPR